MDSLQREKGPRISVKVTVGEILVVTLNIAHLLSGCQRDEVLECRGLQYILTGAQKRHCLRRKAPWEIGGRRMQP